ncbi:hypothetical protein BUALT_Bualt05G0008900 [Buddleja alternifolia]|uniref:RNA helicase n=1 Tax=Buddleja alternifolia TaxID=168488 RepID=A0AAV6XJT4_9LAMI|nr:hypothetical protein BUALT_Bualt05G0008900 [Buddleja alternifolia]
MSESESDSRGFKYMYNAVYAEIVPSVAIGFTAYDTMKTWMRVPPRQTSKATSAISNKHIKRTMEMEDLGKVAILTLFAISIFLSNNGRVEALEENVGVIYEDVIQLKQQLNEFMKEMRDITAALMATQVGATNSATSTATAPPAAAAAQPHNMQAEGVTTVPSLPNFTGDDPLGWLARLDQHFDLYPCHDEQKIQLSMVAMEGIALNWFRWFKRKRPRFSWQELTHALIARFDDRCDGNAYERLASTRHTETVEKYIDSFTQLANQLPALTEETLLGLFMHGLREDVRVQVRVLDPVDLDAAMKMALNLEVALRVQQAPTQPGGVRTPTNARGGGTGPGPTRAQFARLSDSKREDLRRRGLCYRSPELELEEIELTEYVGEQGKDEVDQPVEEVAISMCSAVGISGPMSMWESRGKMIVLDEADEMLSREFKDQIHDIFQLLPPKIQVGVFSATMPPEALEITRKFMNKPVRILVKRDELTLEGIKQFYVDVEKEEWKLETVCDLCKTLAITQSVIFVNTRRKVDWLTNKMRSRDHTVSAIHGDMRQNTRDIIMREFRSGSSRVLITTDLLARGIDVQQVSLVINFDLPTQPENYLHRIGRSGRFGRKGVAINFVTKDDDRMFVDIQKFYNVVVEELPANVADLL